MLAVVLDVVDDERLLFWTILMAGRRLAYVCQEW